MPIGPVYDETSYKKALFFLLLFTIFRISKLKGRFTFS